MGMQWTTNAQQVAPSAAVGVSVTPSGTAWVDSSWVQVIASASADAVLTGIIVAQPGISNVDFEVDIGVGGAGSEVVIATVKGFFIDNLAYGPNLFPCILPIDAIPNGSRVAVRMRKSGTSVLTWSFAITYYLKPITGTLLVTASPLLCVPTGAVGVSATANLSTWVSGSWVELIASTASAIVVTGVYAKNSLTGLQYEVDIGTGGAGSETTVHTVRCYNNNGDGGPYMNWLRNPLDNIPSSTRVACRARANSGSQVVLVGLLYHAKPL